MAEAMEVQIAAAMVTEINHVDRTWVLKPEVTADPAVRLWAPLWTMAELNRLCIAVVPVALDRTRLGRDRIRNEYTIAIDIQRRVDPSSVAMLDRLAEFAEQIHDWFDNAHALTGLTGYQVTQAARGDSLLYDRDLLYDHKVWETEIQVTVWGYKSDAA